ncbi:malonic semialdehyde reductase [Nesterenkonia cremea]|uniref:Nitroreductase family protein n=1 Tax=Nesterenkonia cremea TaxID=1882340 RepID=A0A917AL75_9MICC|nr:malonic semialdehyde reductase [Nesterenkonia cremea]GGE58315.1 nitroreductase family protein [Nesterenkonia cremea]
MSATTVPTLDNKALDALFSERHTTNFFTDTPVDPALVRESYEDARWAPTSMNIQPLRISVLQQGPAREAVVEHMLENNQAKTQAAPLTIVAAMDPNWHEHMETLFPHVPGLRENFDGKEEARLAMGRDNAFLQLGYLLLSLRAHGLEVGPMTGIKAEGIDSVLHTENSWKTLAVVNVGHGADASQQNAQRPRGARLQFDEVSQIL